MQLALLFLLGLILGSFLNALVYRMHAGQDWIKSRSQCEACGHQLAALDLVPVLSWLMLKGRCRYCGKKISWQHPAVELAAGLAFAASYLWWPVNLDQPGQHLLFAGWTICLAGLVALAVYDLRFMLLPNKIIYPTLLVSVVVRVIYIFGYQPNKLHALAAWAASLAVASGLFLAIFVVSRGKWIGYGDVRLGLITGTILADPAKAFLMIFAASLLGSLVSIGLILAGRKSLGSKIPFGPYLITGTFLALLFGPGIISWYNRIFLG